MKRAIGVLGLLVGLLALPLAISTTPAAAASDVPVLASPANGATPSANPVLQWNPADGAVRYRVQVASTNNFANGTLVYNTLTYNTRATVPDDLPLATYWWRVSSLDNASAESAFSTVRNFTKTAAAAPTPTSPLIGTTRNFPTDPAVFTWEALPGADSYDIEIDDDGNFINAFVDKTDSNSYTLTTPQAIGQTYFWRVRGRSATNVPTNYSEPQSYTVQWPTVPQLLTPADSNNPSIEDIVFTWTPVPGAAQYDIQVSPNGDFSGAFTLNTTIDSTVYNPPTTFQNGAYFWRVRARNAGDGLGNWSQTFTFTRAWPQSVPEVPGAGGFNTITLLQPANNSAVTMPNLEFRWTPQRLASRYELQVSTNQNFSPGTVESCVVNQPSYTPEDECDIFTGPSGTLFYWRVRGIDDPRPVNGVFSPTFQYILNYPVIVPTAPANGASLTAPVLEWQPSSATARYRVLVIDKDGDEVVDQTTWNFALAPRDLDPDQSPFRWTVYPVSGNGPIPALQDWRTFTVTAPATSPTPSLLTPANNAGPFYRPPNMTWTPVTGAESYRVMVAPQGGNTFFELTDTRPRMAAYVHPEDDLGAGVWQWYVEALQGAIPIASSSIRTFTIIPPDVTQLTAPVDCKPNQACSPELTTPTLRWNAVFGATSYLVYRATDPNFTNTTKIYETTLLSLTPREALPDSQAGQATYWYARPCWSPSNCGPEPSTFADDNPTPVRAFQKRSVPVSLISPANGATVPDQVTFTWQDYLLTNQATSPTATQSGRQYRVQVSTTADFSNIIDTSPLVDQRTYTDTTDSYPEGPLYWRVQATDGTQNPLTYSEVRSLTKSSPTLALTSPTHNANVNGVPLFRWTPQAFAAEYEIEVYKNPDAPLSTANRVVRAFTEEAAYAPDEALPVGAYGWRVRRIDQNGNPGPWSTGIAPGPLLRKFNLTGAQPGLVTPAANAVLTNSTLLFQWDPVQGAARYRIEIANNAGFSPIRESQVVDGTAWAPTSKFDDGNYYWRVVTIDQRNQPIATSAARMFTKSASTLGDFYPLPPARILDTRKPTPDPLDAGDDRSLTVTGVGGVPSSGVSAIVANVTAVGPTADSFLKIWPSGVTKPPVSNLNYVTGQTIPNLVTVKVGSNGRIILENNKGSVNVLVDVVGYYSNGSLPPGARFQTTTAPTRILDTRTEVPPRPFQTNETREVVVAGIGGVPANASAVVLNATVTGGTQASDLRLWPKGVAQPNTSNLNFTPGLTIANLVVVKVGQNGAVNVRNSSGTVNVIFDVVGWFETGDPPPGNRFNAVDPARIVDTRQSGTLGAGGRLTARVNRTITVAGKGGVPNDGSVKAVLMNVTVAGPAGPGFLTVWPGTVARPQASNINFATGQSIPNQVVAGVNAQGQVQVYSVVGTDVIFDVVGYYS